MTGAPAPPVAAILAAYNSGDLVRALALAEALTQADPGESFGWSARAAILHKQGRHEPALACARRAIDLGAADAELENTCAAALLALGRADAAEAHLRRATALAPSYAEAHANLGRCLAALGRPADAETSLRRATELKPASAQAHFQLGNCLYAQGRPRDAEACYRRTVALAPDDAPAHSNLGICLQYRGALAEAEASYRQALALKADYPEALNNLGSCLKDQGRFDEAEASFRRALAIDPGYLPASENLLFLLNYADGKSAAEVRAAYDDFDRRFGAPLRGEWRPHANPPAAGRKLKIGYVSPDFRRHSSRHFVEPLLAHHDRRRFEIHAYADLRREDDVTARYRRLADSWVPTAGLTDASLAERVRADAIDILVDLAGHTAGNRLGVFARKPAPVSVTWLGYVCTTGLSAIDYILTDPDSAPDGSEAHFAETPWRIQTPGYVYRPAEGMGEPGESPALRNGFVTFGTLTRAVRINARLIRVWAELLAAVPDSRLVVDSLSFADPASRARLADAFAAHGTDRGRLAIGFHSPPWDVLRGIDIGLDCFPHNSGATLFETLYMGAPFVTLAGRPSVGRIGGSILRGTGCGDWIANDEAEYVRIAAGLAADRPHLAALRAGLRAKMQASALMDEAGFARKVEDAYAAMFARRPA